MQERGKMEGRMGDTQWCCWMFRKACAADLASTGDRDDGPMDCQGNA